MSTRGLCRLFLLKDRSYKEESVYFENKIDYFVYLCSKAIFLCVNVIRRVTESGRINNTWNNCMFTSVYECELVKITCVGIELTISLTCLT